MDKPKGPLAILLIDPDESHFQEIREKLAKDSAHRVHFHLSKNFSEALLKIKQNRYHLILLHQSAEASQVLKKINQSKIGTPVILLVRPGEEAHAHGLLKCGATDYVIHKKDEIPKFADRLWTIYRNYELSHPPAIEKEIAHQNRQLAEINGKLRQLSIRDELTGLYNHRYLQEKMVEEFSRAARYGHPLSCILLDLDHFRKVNDHFGPGAGDEILKEASEILLQSSRLSDLISRFGGEEFVILLPHVDYQGALELAERIRTIFAKHTFLPQTRRINLTVSIGISSFPDDLVKDRSDLLAFADQALFRAKAGGRNQICMYRHLLPSMRETMPHLQISEEKIHEFQKKLAEVADRARQDYIDSSRALISALETKDHFTAGHAGNVSRMAKQVAETLGLPLDEAEVVGHAGLLHDIGKICISDDILMKPSRLTLAEYEAMKQHPYFGYRIVKPIKFLREEAALILHHHEWFNGEGYPCRLSRNEIPLGSRIVAVVDSYDTMRLAGGRYKETITVEAAVNELIACSGIQFDPEVVHAFVQVLLMRKELDPDGYDRQRLREAVKGKV